MQTFLPYPDFIESAKALDRKRLGKQRVEGYQILKALFNPGYGWQNHPAVNMWRGYEDSLIDYVQAVCLVWSSYGYKDSIAEKVYNEFPYNGTKDTPEWLGDEDFHKSHQSNLKRKDGVFYSFNVPNDLPYVWPV
jgi:hypothetical protein